MRFGGIGLKGDKGLFILSKNIREYKRFVYRMSGYYSIKSCRYVIFHRGSGCVFFRVDINIDSLLNKLLSYRRNAVV